MGLFSMVFISHFALLFRFSDLREIRQSEETWTLLTTEHSSFFLGMAWLETTLLISHALSRLWPMRDSAKWRDSSFLPPTIAPFRFINCVCYAVKVETGREGRRWEEYLTSRDGIPSDLFFPLLILEWVHESSWRGDWEGSREVGRSIDEFRDGEVLELMERSQNRGKRLDWSPSKMSLEYHQNRLISCERDHRTILNLAFLNRWWMLKVRRNVECFPPPSISPQYPPIPHLFTL